MTVMQAAAGQARRAGMVVRALPAALGAEVTGVDLRHPDEVDFDAIRQAWAAHVLLVFRGQQLAPRDIVEVARRFGTPICSRTINQGKIDDPVYALELLPPEITAITNVKQDGKPIGHLGDAEVVWHSDHSYLERPAAARMLYGAECPPPEAGGNTSFLNAYAAWDEMPAGLKARVAGRSIKHDNAISVTMEVRQGADMLQSIQESPGPSHPIVSTHPETGHHSIFLGRRARAYVNGLPLAESEALLEELWAHATQERFTCTHRWAPGDLVLWDNRCTMHRRTAFDPSLRRMLYAAQVEGHRPYEAADALRTPPHPRYRAFAEGAAR